jgi:uncharacterized protein (TIGR02996 family)
MSSLDKALLADIIEHPDDDAPRLVYSDWLEEHGGPPERIEAIRLSVRRRRLDDLDPEAWVVDTRRHRIEIERPRDLPKMEGVSVSGEWTGLFTSASAQSPAPLRHHEDTLFALGPIETLQLGMRSPADPPLLAASPHLHRLRRLEVLGLTRPENIGLPILFNAPGLSSLRELELAEGCHGDNLLESLASCPSLPNFELLDLTRNWFGQRGFRALASSPVTSTLRTLLLARNSKGNEWLREVVRSPHLRRLRRLKLSECNLGTRVIKDLTAAPWPELEVLDLASNDLGPAAIRYLVETPNLPSLRKLDLSGNSTLGDAPAKVLARAKHFDPLRVLALGFWRIGRRGLAALAEAPWLSQLTWLDLMSLDLRQPEMEVLAGAPLHGLRKLELNYNHFGAAEVKALLTAPWIGGLTHLDLSKNAIGTEGARALAEAPQLDNLVELDVTGNDLPSEAGDLLRQRFGERVQVKTSWEE